MRETLLDLLVKAKAIAGICYTDSLKAELETLRFLEATQGLTENGRVYAGGLARRIIDDHYYATCATKRHLKA